MTTTADLTSEAAPPLVRRAGGAPTLDLVIPVYSEERDLGPAVQRVHDYLTATFPCSFRITIAHNASTDSTWFEAQLLENRLERFRAVHLPASEPTRRTAGSGTHSG